MHPPSQLTKSQIDRLGHRRLREGYISEDDLRLLDSYRRSFTDAYEDVIGLIRDRLGLEPTGRPAKSTTSIIDKLQRESTRLSQMQDIAGCRVTVEDIPTQDEVVARLSELFDRLTVVDRRENPSHGYRAVHVIVDHHDSLVEVQVRTSLQHLWAELSEKLSDVVDPGIKYGEGDQEVVQLLADASDRIRRHESLEREITELVAAGDQDAWLADQLADDINRVMSARDRNKEAVVDVLNAVLERVLRMKGRKDAVPD